MPDTQNFDRQSMSQSFHPKRGFHGVVDLAAPREMLAAAIRRYDVPGAQLVVYHEEKLAAACAGVERVDTSREVRPNSRFPFGSVTKAFTATVVMQLVSDGDLELDAPVAEYVPELRDGSPDWRQVTLRQVLSHTSGAVADHGVDDSTESSLRSYVVSCRDVSGVCPPGAAFSYSNTGYVVAGRCVEQVTGYGWWPAVESFLSRPLGLGLGCLTDGATRRGMVAGHAVSAGRAWPVEVELPTTWAPAGGLAGSAADLVALAQLHLGVRQRALLSPATASEMREPVGPAQPVGLAAGWGLGVALYGGGWVGHDGTLDGVVCNLRWHPDTSTAVGFVANATSGSDLWEDLAGGLVESGFPSGLAEGDRPTPAELPVDRSSGYPGEYANGRTTFRVYVDDDGALKLTETAGFSARLAVNAGDYFTVHRRDTLERPHSGKFLRDLTGRVGALQISGRIARRIEGITAGTGAARSAASGRGHRDGGAHPGVVAAT
ncbi:serine hydrolase domain-containing protein [Phytohabitans kaempferiae]|uniref:Serine hydrolase domain-containing protein n=1 Tax=Phytohabitans kaempferiae TaxID=1620943 RepID=A0ABV6M983_9ACTN